MHCTKMHHFCGLKFASCHAIYCIIRMHPTHASCMLHLTHNHLCIVLGLPRPSNQAQGSLTRNISGIFIPLHISSSGFFNPQHIWDLYPTAYFKLRVPQTATYLESLSHCIFSSQGSLTRNISEIFIPLHMSSSGFFNPQHIWDLYPTAYFKLRVPQRATYLGPLSHCIFSSQGSLTRNISGIFIPLHIQAQGSLT